MIFISRFLSSSGAAAIRFTMQDTGASFTFVSAHLAPHNHNVARRNANYRALVSSLVFTNGQKQIYDTSYLFVMGDLNYRISTMHPERLAIKDIGAFLSEGNMEGLLKHDQLRHELKAGKTLHGLQEGKITFPPTYKFVKGTDRYQVRRELSSDLTVDLPTERLRLAELWGSATGLDRPDHVRRLK